MHILQNEEIKAQGGVVSCLRSHSLLAAKLGLGSTSFGDSDEKMGFSSVICSEVPDSPNTYHVIVLVCFANNSS